jgi:phosphate-selective porin OprO/OprP
LTAILSIPAVGFGADDIEALKKQIQELDQKVRILERRNELNAESAETRSKESSRLAAGTSGFSFSSADTNFVLNVRGYVQADGRFYVNDHIPGNDTFLMRRVRPIFEGTVFKYYDYRIMLDFGSGINNSAANDGFLQDGYLNIHYWPQFQIQVGKFKEPVGLERLQSGANLLFAERGLPTQLVPNRDVGLQLHGEVLGGGLYYQAGVFNGVQDGASGDSDVGTDDHKDVAARLFAQPFKNTKLGSLQGLGVGFAGTYGNQSGTLPTFKTPGQQTFFSYATGAGNTFTNVVADGEHWRLVPQAYWYWGPFGIFGEYVISSQKIRRDALSTPTNAVSSLFDTAHNGAWQVAGSWFVTGEQNSFSTVTPSHPLNLEGGGWGALELAARYGELTLDDELFGGGGAPSFAAGTSARKVRSWGVGLNWYLNRNIKLTLDYDQTQFRGGSQRPGAVTAQDEQVIISRAQFSF